MNIPIVFFGTHHFATKILEGLIKSPFISIELVVTQPDKPVGRKKEIKPSPVKLLAEKYNIKVEQPDSLKNFNIKENKYKLGIVAQYGNIIPKKIIDAPEFGTLNVHTSLLPKYRGASPIQTALINGDIETGVTIMKMDEGLDTGPILIQKMIEIDPDDTYNTLDNKLSKIGLQALLGVIPGYIEGSISLKQQNDSEASLCKQLDRESGKISWNKSCIEIYNLYRGLTPWPGIWTKWNDKRLKLIKIKPSDKNIKPGEVLTGNGKIYIGCKTNSIEVVELQLEGKKIMKAKEFLNGYKNFAGSTLK
jgi:methionyl-tRNA formyltransferase